MVGGIFCGIPTRLNLIARWVKLSLNEDLVEDEAGLGGPTFSNCGEESRELCSVGVGGSAVFGAGR